MLPVTLAVATAGLFARSPCHRTGARNAALESVNRCRLNSAGGSHRKHSYAGARMNIAPLISERARELFELYDTYDRPRDQYPAQSNVRDIIENLRRQGGEIFVGKQDGILVGTYSIYICQNLCRNGRPFGVIEHVICHPDYRRQGIGRALMRHAIAYANENNCYKLVLTTGETRPENHAFYEACGFKGDKRGFQMRLPERSGGRPYVPRGADGKPRR